jgi:hypothetical protein
MKRILLLGFLLAGLAMAGCWKGTMVARGNQGTGWAAGGPGPSVYHCVSAGGQARCSAAVER